VDDFVDALVRAEPAPVSARNLPPGCVGAVFFGACAQASWQEAAERHRGLLWRHAVSGALPWRALPLAAPEAGSADVLVRLVRQGGDPRAPGAAVLDLAVDSGPLLEWLQRPAAWWPLCHPLARTGRLVRLPLPPGVNVVVKVKQLARRFPETRFWVDPFSHGPVAGWQGHVRLAEEPNVTLTTLSLDPFAGRAWTHSAAAEALYFTTGEVGAAKLLYASGQSGGDWLAGRDQPMREWLAGAAGLDAAEARLVLAGNAERLAGSGPRPEG